MILSFGTIVIDYVSETIALLLDSGVLSDFKFKIYILYVL